ncbi:L,D-transpeptidase family protein [Sulfurimonas paralvinellae]|uniref:L,D-transpeptidase family protein n=2 Tax=Sulfurimonas paralvinellae TaxID=317658 RepID=A0A7M1BB93_9BACT|nr:L,D-transpeptidase family protein [Sulfurimonas paralvinellae]
MYSNTLHKFTFVLLLTFLSTSLFAADTDLLTQYRKNGIKNIEKMLDKELTQEIYWENYLKNVDTTFGYFESYDNVLACDKTNSKLCIYKKDDNNSYQLKREYSAFTGKLQGDKEREGDLRTPIGIYDIVKKITKVDSFYGPMAFVTSYPNVFDKYKGKTGQGIWIHGLPMHQERDSFTKGCIAIDNTSIKCLDKNIDINKTVLIIDKELPEKQHSKKEFSTILSNLFAWRYAWIYNDIESYLGFYAPEFKRFDGMDIEKFTKYKKRIFNKQEKKTIIFNDINIIPYPETDNVFKIKFKEKYRSPSFSFTGDKVLIVKLEKKHLYIITEK